ncbi:hypothetical protein HY410_00480 [Candidatus Gottesmanbacteria bacterium]|nr:hypothetical protein [Candidatus Gottesmanbacteria bacterium]
MRISEAAAVRITRAYANIFDYQLSEEELRFWCVYRVLPEYNHSRRIKPRRYTSRHKWNIAHRVAWWLKIIPTVTCIGVTGGLAMNNAKGDDDIDFLVITKPATLWITRLVTTLVLDLFSLRRRPGDKTYKDKICLNMFMSADALAVPEYERDLFVAHEVLQMKPLWDRNETYQKFLKTNSWVKKFLPTAWKEKNYELRITNYEEKSRSSLRLLEPLAKKIQLWYMRKRRTTEVISDTLIRFHPVDAREWIYRELQKRLRGTNIPLDKIFYSR